MVTGYLLTMGDYFAKDASLLNEVMTVWKRDDTRDFAPRRHQLESQMWRDLSSLLGMKIKNDEPIVGVFPTWTQKEKIGDSDNKEEIHYYLQTYNSSTGHYMPGIIYANPSYYNGIVKHIEFETGHSESAVRKMSQRYLNAYHTPYRYSINARVLDGYYMGEEVWRIELMQKYRVIIPFPGRNVDAELLCLSYELDITNPSNCTYLFGTYIPQDILKTRYLTGR